MSVILTKGSRIDLTKSNPGLKNVDVGLGWDPKQSEKVQDKKGLLGKILSRAEKVTAPDVDIDASAFLLDADKKVKRVIYFGNQSDPQNGVKLSGDDLTGASAASGGDNEIIFIDLPAVNPAISQIDIWANIYNCKERKQHFGQVKNAFIRLVDRNTKNEVCCFDLSEEYDGKTAVKMGSLYRHNTEWKFKADGEGTFDTKMNSIKSKY